MSSSTQSQPTTLGFIEERFVHYFDLAMERLDQHRFDARLHPALADGEA